MSTVLEYWHGTAELYTPLVIFLWMELRQYFTRTWYGEGNLDARHAPLSDICVTNATTLEGELLWHRVRVEIGTYVQPVKIAAVLTISVLFIILPSWTNAVNLQNSLWATLTVIFVRCVVIFVRRVCMCVVKCICEMYICNVCVLRREHAASSFLVGIQRLEGTVV